MLFLRTIALMLVLLGAAMVAVGTWRLLGQHDANRRYVPVQARVASAEIVEDRIPTKQGVRLQYRPVIVYEYTVGGALHRGNRLLPVQTSHDRADAEAILARYPPGSVVTAFIDPSNPAQSILMRQVSFAPYGLTMFGPLFVSVGLLLLFTREQRGGEAIRGDSHWFILPQQMTLAARRGVALLGLFVFVLVTLAPIHYFSSGGAKTTTAVAFTAVYVVGLVVLLTIALRQVKLSSALGEPRALIDPHPLQRGQRNRVRLELPVRPGRRVRGVTLRLRCVELNPTRTAKRGLRRDVLYERAETVLADASGGPSPLHADVGFELPEQHPPSTSASQRGYPRFAWELHALVELVGAPSYSATWTVFVS